MPDGMLNHLLGTDITWLGNRKTALFCVVIAHVDVDRLFLHHLHVQLTEYIDGYSGSGGYRRSRAVQKIQKHHTADAGAGHYHQCDACVYPVAIRYLTLSTP